MVNPSNNWHALYQERFQEHAARPLRVEGNIPADLNGCYFQNGPCNFDRYDNIILADVLLRSIRIANEGVVGSVSKLAAETELSVSEHRNVYDRFGTYRSIWKKISLLLSGRAPVKNVASTSIWSWQDQLLALYEVALPSKVNAQQLKIESEIDARGTIKAAFSAHPHRINQRHCSYNFGTRMGLNGTWLDIYACPDAGEMTRLVSINLKRHCLGFIHDFAVTENYLIFVVPAIDMGLKEFLAIAAGGSPLDVPKWKSEIGNEIVVIPIDQPNTIIRFPCTSFFPLHFSNAFEESGRIVLDYIFNPDTAIYKVFGQVQNMEDTNDLKNKFPDHFLKDNDYGRLQRVTIDLEKQSIKQRFLSNEAVEFPRINSNVQGQAYRYVYALSNSDDNRKMQPWFQGYRKFDLLNTSSEFYEFPDGHLGMEPCFVSSNSSENSEAEDDGYMLATVLDSKNGNTYLGIFDAKNIVAGPIAKIHFDQQLPIAFHGSFVRNMTI